MSDRDGGRYEALAGSIEHIVFVTDRSSRMLWASPQLELQTGFSVRDFQFPQADNPFIHPDDQARVAAHVGAFLASDRAVSAPVDNRFYDRWGRIRHYRSIISKVEWAGVPALQFVTAERRTAEGEHELRTSEERYRMLVEGAIDAIVRIDPSGRIAYANEQTTRMLRYTMVELRKSALLDLVVADDRDEVASHLVRATAGMGALACFDARFEAKDGAIVWGNVRAARVALPGEEGSLQAIIRDVTLERRLTRERRDIEERAHRAERLASVALFAAGVAHDLNNLLAISEVSVDVAARHATEPDRVRQSLDEIRYAGERARDLTRQLLALSGRQALETRETDLRDVVRGALPLYRRGVPENVRLELDLDDAPCPARVDRGKIEQVLMNLVLNARDALPGGGTIGIRVRCTPRGGTTIEVTDDGIGMDAATCARVFEPFFTTKERGRGRGLGLATAYAIVRQHAGEIDVRSAPGQGATFVVSLPPAADPDSAPDAGPRDGGPREGG